MVAVEAYRDIAVASVVQRQATAALRLGQVLRLLMGWLACPSCRYRHLSGA